MSFCDDLSYFYTYLKFFCLIFYRVKLAVHVLDCGGNFLVYYEQCCFSTPGKRTRDRKCQEPIFVTDHDFQTALTEALCRIMPPDQRKGVADKLFPMEHVASAFVKLRDSEFETVNYFPTSVIQSKLTFQKGLLLLQKHG